MIIYGSRMYGKRNVINGWGECEHCGAYGKNSSYNGRKWGHLYFIPLIPMGESVRVLNECKACSNGSHLPESDVTEVLEELRNDIQKALARLIEGEKNFGYHETELPCTLFLANNIEVVKCLDDQNLVDLVVAALKEKELHYPHHMVNGRLLEFQGKLQEAGTAYQQAATEEPEDILPIISLGAIYFKQKEYEAARLAYEKALESLESQERLQILGVLLSVYELQKDFTALTDTYEECLQLVPEYAQDKPFMKGYKKACKKAGREPVK